MPDYLEDLANPFDTIPADAWADQPENPED